MPYFPSYFPSFNETYSIPIETLKSKITSLNNVKLNKAKQLDTVAFKASKKYTKLEKLANKAIISRFDIISEKTKLRGIRIDTYLQRLGYKIYFDILSDGLTIMNPGMGGSVEPLVYMDNTLLNSAGSQ